MKEKPVIGAQIFGEESNPLVKSVEALENPHGWFSFGNHRKSTLDEFLQTCNGRDVAMVLPSNLIFVRFLNYPIEGIGGKKLMQCIRYDAQQQIPFPLDEVFLDYIIQGENADKTLNVKMAAIEKKWVSKMGLEDIAKKVRLRVLGESGQPLYNSIEQANGRFFGVLNMDDKENLDMHFYNQGREIFARSIPLENNTFDNDAINDAIGELQRSLGYIKYMIPESLQLHQILLSGDIAKRNDCGGIIDYISNEMDVDTIILQSYSGRADYAVPVGVGITYLKNKEQINFLSHKEPIDWAKLGKNTLFAVPRGIGYAFSSVGNALDEFGKSLKDFGK